MKFFTNYDFYTAPRANVFTIYRWAQNIKKTFKLFSYIVEKIAYLLVVRPCVTWDLNSPELYSEAEKVNLSSFVISQSS